MKIFNAPLIATAALLTVLAAVGVPGGSAEAQTIPVTDQPLFTTAGVPPLMMMVMSRDEQLFNKAYTDYTDLDGDNLLDTTYQDRFDYSGYFDSGLCYDYSVGLGVFSASDAATGSLAAGQKFPHQCNSKWSGNFLNWVAMSRLDMLRSVLYGGYRSTDSLLATVLERALIPNDLHAWVKVYTGSDVSSYTPYSQNSTTPGISFCNATFGAGTTGAPIIRVAKGTYTEWAATALQQCTWGSGDNAPSGNALGGSAGDYTARVQVCGSGGFRESFCQKYTSNLGLVSYKPVGLLQNYGEKGLMRFGLISGTYSKPRSGGVLRRNIGLIGGNSGVQDLQGCAAGDEISTQNGQFCTRALAAGTESIIKTMNSFRLTQWNGSSDWNDCNTYGILNRNGAGSPFLNNPGTVGGGQNCSAWGNPLSEMYAEAVRYISSGTDGTPSTAFTGGTDLTGLPTPTWVDPYGGVSTANGSSAGGNPYCASCSILVLASGLNSFDSDEVPSVNSIGGSNAAASATTLVGAHEPVSGNYLIGRNATGTPGNLAVGLAADTYADLCTSKGVADLALVRGICPDIPALEGSYLMAGLAWKAWTTDLRPSLLNSKGQPKPAAAWNQVQTYAVALAENLPKFQIPVGGGFITLAPLAQANNDGGATAASTGWRSSFLGSVTIGPKKSAVSPNYVYGRALAADNTEGSFSWVWEDSLWGNDHDNDVVTMLTYCVGARCNTTSGYGGPGKDICWRTSTNAASADYSPACGTNGNPTVAADEALVRVENLSAYAGNAMLTGYAMTGSDNDGSKRLTLRPGGTDSSVLTSVASPPAAWYKPMVLKFKYSAAGAAKQLDNPLFFSAKYGGFTKPDAANPGKRRNPVAAEMPDAGDWEALDSAGLPTSVPSNYFLVRDPTKLKDQLQKVFDKVIAGSSQAGSVASSASRFTVGQTLAYQASYDSNNWVGDLKGFNLNPNGSLGTQAWSAASLLPAGARNSVWIGVAPNATSTTFTAAPFTRGNLPNWMQTALAAGGSWPTSGSSLDALIAYLKGDQTNEEPLGSYRKRDVAKRLGDIVNSSPQVAYKLSFGYDALPNPTGCNAACTSSYKCFVFGPDTQSPPTYTCSTPGKTTTTVFVGAGDGMLHAFDGSATGGNELFSYIPNAVISKLGKLPKPGYVHTYYVDGSPAIGDAYVGGNWKTLLVASAGAGAPSVFALDVTNPASFGASSFLWEFNATVDADMGQFTGIPSPPTLTSDGNWVTAFGNGYNGASKKAKLFVLDVSSGARIAVDPITDSANAAPNGLSTATIVDASGTCPSGGAAVCSDGVGDTIYAGDYLGNVWKFVLSGNRWVLSPSRPIFKAVDQYNHKQPITSGMYAIKNPLGGVIIYFGTGKYLETSDNDPDFLQPDGNVLVNSVYAIWDNGSGVAVTRGDLQQQVIQGYTGGSFDITQNAFGYRTALFPAGKMGWLIDLKVASATPDPLRGERVVAAPTGLLNKLFLNAFRPIGDICLPAGVNSLLELDLLNGGAAFPPGNGGTGGDGTGSGQGGADIGNGPPLSSPNPVISIPGHTGIPAIGCPAGDPNCVSNPRPWCTNGVPGYPNCACANPAAPPGTPSNSPLCDPPPSCTPTTAGYPYCSQGGVCSLVPNTGSAAGTQTFQCRASWRQLR